MPEISSDSSKNPIHCTTTGILVTPDFNAMARVVFWNSTGFFFFSFVIPYVLAQMLNATGTELGVIYTGNLFGALISSPLAGFMADKYNKKKIVLVGGVGRGVSYIFLYIAILFNSLILVAISFVFLGFMVGFFWPPFDVLVSQKSHLSCRTYAFGIRNRMTGYGNLVGSIISFTIFGLGSLYQPNNVALLYCPLILFALSNFYGGIEFVRKVDEKLTLDEYFRQNGLDPNGILKVISPSTDSNPTPGSDLPINRKNPIPKGFIYGFITLLLVVFISHINANITQPFVQVYLYDIIVPNATLVMLIVFPADVISMLLAPKMGQLIDKFNEFLGVAISCVMGAIITWFIIQTQSGWVFAILLICDTVFSRGEKLVVLNIFSRVSQKNRGKIFGISNWTTHMGDIVGPIIGGLAWDAFNQQAPFVISIYMELLMIPAYFLAIYWLRPHLAEKRETPHEDK
jgi:MFS family permease